MQALVTARLRLEPMVEAHSDALFPILVERPGFRRAAR
jgi:hypothetical protein